MSFLVNDKEIASATCTIPNIGVWQLHVRLVGEQLLAVGSRVTVTLGDLTLVGTVRDAAAYVSRSEAQIVGGADGWSKIIKRRSYRENSLVRLAKVAKDLGVDTRETIEVLPGTDRELGYAWTRPEGVASMAAFDLGVPWWVGVDGVTRFGARPELERADLQVGVLRYEPARRYGVFTTPEDGLSAFVPGTFISGEALPRVRVRSTTIRVTERQVTAEVLW